MYEKISRIVRRQYYLPLETVAMIDRYSLENNKRKSEVIEMAIKQFLAKESMRNIASALIIVGVTAAANASGLDSVDQNSIIEKIGNIIKSIGAIVAFGSLGYALILGALKWNEDQAEAIQHIKGGVIGAFLGGASWGISKWLIGILS